jgi:SAM-dependent methyltransferase
MHTSALILGKAFFELYPRERPAILDIGSRDVNGTLRAYAPPGARYIGIDLEAGPGVDVVLQDPYAYPFPDGTFDLVVSTSTFEHDKLFWLTLLQCCRVLKPDGVMYINAPSNGSYHGWPHDYWRFYPDSSVALRDWALRMNQPIHLIESFTGPQYGSEWNDYVMIFTRQEGFVPPHYLSDAVPHAHNIRRGEEPTRNLRQHPQDQVIITELQEQVQKLTETARVSA